VRWQGSWAWKICSGGSTSTARSSSCACGGICASSSASGCHRRSLERRLKEARIGRFKPLCDFDWSWPKRCDRAAVEALMGLDFLKEADNVVLVGPNGVGKSTLAQNIAHQALIEDHTVLFTSTGQLLGDLCTLDGDAALRRRLRRFAGPELLVIDEVGYLSYSNRHADLMFEMVSRRYQVRSTLMTTNRPLAEWCEVFPNAACVVSLLERRRGDQGGWCITPRSSPSKANPRLPPGEPHSARHVNGNDAVCGGSFAVDA